MASNCSHAYRKTLVYASVILIPSKIIGVEFHESKPITILMGKLTYDSCNIIIGIEHIAAWSSIFFEIDWIKIVPDRVIGLDFINLSLSPCKWEKVALWYTYLPHHLSSDISIHL